MTPLDLLRARAAFIDLARPSVDLCKRLGLNWAETDAHAGGPLMAPVKFSGQWFDFDADGVEAAVIEIRAADAWTVLDLLAWLPAIPDRWFLAVGGSAALGVAHAMNPTTYASGLPLQIYKSPASWLQERCFGAVLLDLDTGVEWMTSLSLAGTIAVRDDAHARQIDGARRRMGLSRHQRLVVPMPALSAVA